MSSSCVALGYRRPLSLLMLDVDTFKEVNDTYGHLVGDQVLAAIGRRLEDIVRMTDIKCRYGGDEFLILLPDTPAIGGRQVAESVRQVLSTIRVPTGDGTESRPISVSVGVATLRSDDRDITTVIARADQALYEAKHQGRDCVSTDADAAPDTLRLVYHVTPAKGTCA